MSNNLILMTDSYKSSHFEQYPPGLTSLFSYLESRGGKYDKTVFFGLQYLLKEYLSKPITAWMLDEAAKFFQAHGEPFPFDGFKHIILDLDGYIPLRIRAVPEGSIVPNLNALMTVESTDPAVPWVVSWFETLLMRLWYPVTVSTQSYYIKQTILNYLEKTADDPKAEINFKLHDFGARGVSSHESAAIGGAAHLVNFMGSDTVEGVLMANRIYKHPMAAFSIPAAEHSSITSWGRNHEADAYANMLEKFAKPGKLVAIVSDSYDLRNACENIWGGMLRQKIIDSGATVIIRPDSGDPRKVVLSTVGILANKFGFTVNKKGYKVLNNVRVIQGDGINGDTIEGILDDLEAFGFSATNIAFGMGGALLQQVNRDTQKFAYKCSSCTVNGVERDVFKDPVTDPGKRSKAGRLDLIKYRDEFMTTRLAGGVARHDNSLLETVFENGEIKKEYSLDEIRARTDNG